MFRQFFKAKQPLKAETPAGFTPIYYLKNKETGQISFEVGIREEEDRADTTYFKMRGVYIVLPRSNASTKSHAARAASVLLDLILSLHPDNGLEVIYEKV